ncbi:MAG: hydantoinase B/oxoprolinase family protein [Candidatus Acetothermia bacterium]|jgi:N-methylhydantoinase B|nr:hydantoinase B/oxoprolinase family protein [Candidatus Acetothermia bacterium]MDH7505461.1 hydantoinase B/oxoprolinase family protein [Candidatus Acetothermia bacterium]
MEMVTRSIDPFTVEVIKRALISAAEQMFAALGRTSKSSVIYEVLDYGCAITDAQGSMIAQANGIPGFIGVLTDAVKDTLQKFGPEGLNEGDVIIINDPYMGGATHQNDVVLVMPIFYQGELIMFTASKAHWSDVGGKDPGSWSTNATEIYQEGIQFPAVKLYDRGREVPCIVEILERNVRTPEMTLGDMRAQAASMKVAVRRVQEVCHKYGLEMVLRAVEAYMEQGRKEALAELSLLPKGDFTAEEYIDDDGVGGDPVLVKVKVTITAEEFIIDFSGSSKTSRGPINSPRSATFSGCKTAYKAVVGPHAHPNDGFFSPLRVIIPEDTVFNPKRPAPVSTYWESMSYATDLVWKALAEAVPHRITAGHFLSVCATNVSGIDSQTGKQFILAEPNAGGWGAGEGKDGENALVCSADGDTYVLSIEVAETRYPIIVTQFCFNTSGTGHGKYRGGFGLVKDYRAAADEILVTGSFGRSKFPAWGVRGGLSGTPNYIVLIPRQGEPRRCSRISVHPLQRGDVVRFITGSGGGYGNPKEREPQLVLEDVIDGFLTVEEAREIYRVEIDPAEMSIRWDETERLRQDQRGLCEDPKRRG